MQKHIHRTLVIVCLVGSLQSLNGMMERYHANQAAGKLSHSEYQGHTSKLGKLTKPLGHDISRSRRSLTLQDSIAHRNPHMISTSTCLGLGSLLGIGAAAYYTPRQTLFEGAQSALKVASPFLTDLVNSEENKFKFYRFASISAALGTAAFLHYEDYGLKTNISNKWSQFKQAHPYFANILKYGAGGCAGVVGLHLIKPGTAVSLTLGSIIARQAEHWWLNGGVSFGSQGRVSEGEFSGSLLNRGSRARVEKSEGEAGFEEDIPLSIKGFIAQVSNPEAAKLIGHPGGVLLEGNSGAGKSFLARFIARQIKNCKILSAEVGGFTNEYQGSSVRALLTLCMDAENALDSGEASSVVIVMDEIDAVNSRTSSGSLQNKETLNFISIFLNRFDYFKDNKIPIYFIGTSNCIARLDEALYRRFEIHETVTLPDENRRKKSIQYFATKLNFLDKIDIDALVRSTNHFSIANIKTSFNNAARILLDKTEERDVKQVIQDCIQEEGRRISQSSNLHQQPIQPATSSQGPVPEEIDNSSVYVVTTGKPVKISSTSKVEEVEDESLVGGETQNDYKKIGSGGVSSSTENGQGRVGTSTTSSEVEKKPQDDQ